MSREHGVLSLFGLGAVLTVTVMGGSVYVLGRDWRASGAEASGQDTRTPVRSHQQ